MADRIYVTYTPTGAPRSFHTAIHYERTSLSGELIKHFVVEVVPEFDKLSGLEKAGNVIGEIFRTGSAPSSFGRMNAMVRDLNVFDKQKGKATIQMRLMKSLLRAMISAVISRECASSRMA